MKLSRTMRWVATGMLVLQVVGCSTTYREPKLDPPTATFEGLTQLLAREPTGALDLFVLHGMCHHDEAWAQEWLSLIAAGLGATPQYGTDPESEPRDEVKVYRADIALPRGLIRAHAVVWSGLTKPLKDRLCYDQTRKSASCSKNPTYPPTPYPWERARLNAFVKDGLLNDCFSDAVIYLGASRQRIVQEMQQAMLVSRASSVSAPLRAGLSPAKASLANTAGLVVLSSSLGSKVVFDAILELTKEERQEARAAGEQLRDLTRQVFMASNQVPLLSLNDERGMSSTGLTLGAQASKRGVFAPDPLDALMEQRNQKFLSLKVRPQMLRVVAFTDPGDLLSYATREYFHQLNKSLSYELIDVIVSNGPTVLTLFENPYDAHAGYGRNPSVMDRLVCGSAGAQGCK